MQNLTIETKIWEGDWELILKTNRLEKLFKRCSHSSAKKILYINNVNSIPRVTEYIKPLINRRIIDQYVVVEEHANKALEHFGLKAEDLGIGYYYSIAELVSIYLCDTKYLLHFSSDTLPQSNHGKEWIHDCLKVLEHNSKVMVCNLTWDKRFKEAKKESLFEDDSFYYGPGFSDQMYMIRSNDFKQKIYFDKNTVSERYPKYGGDLFEKRVDSWMQNNDFLRATHKKSFYLHQNFTKNKWLKKIAVCMNQPTLFSK